MYATQWLLTIFAYSFPFPAVARIWDAFLFEGWKVVFRVALAALQGAEGSLLAAQSFEGIMMAFKRLPGDIDPDELLARTFAFPCVWRLLSAGRGGGGGGGRGGWGRCSTSSAHRPSPRSPPLCGVPMRTPRVPRRLKSAEIDESKQDWDRQAALTPSRTPTGPGG